MVNRERHLQTFLELALIPSPSRQERGVADYVSRALAAAGLEVYEDNAAAAVGGNAGNIIAFMPGQGEAVFLNAHMDTVPVIGKIVPIVDGDFVRSGSEAILGADDKAAVAILLESVRSLRESGAAHRPLELVFTVGEEAGLLGAGALDMSRLTAKTGLVIDGDEPYRVAIGAPGGDCFEITIHGRGGHATDTDNTLSPILVAARAITAMPSGQVDPDTTANIGVVTAGTAVNVVPEQATIKAEVRSHDPAKLAFYGDQLVLRVEQACAAARRQTKDGVVTAHAEIKRTHAFDSYHVDESDPVVTWVMAAIRAAGFTPSTVRTKGAHDTIVFNQRGIRCVAVGNGKRLAHTSREYLIISEFVQAVDVVLNLVRPA